MATFVTLLNFTDQGARNIKDSPDRFDAFKTMVESMGGTVKSVLWTTGAYDMVVVTEGPEENIMPALLKVTSLGNIRSQTMRGYSASEMRKLLAAVK
jgi:uncharacterized protein with GYD domain